MNKVMIVAFAASAMLLLNPLPGFARGSQSQGSYSRGPSAHGSYQHGSQSRGSYSRGGYGSQSRGSYSWGGYGHGGYRGAYRHSGYRYGGYPYGGYRYGGYPYYRSNVYYDGGLWIGSGWGSWWGPAWPYYYPNYSTPPVVIEQSPTEYIQRDQETEEPVYWYYCRNPEGYYPDIQRCPNGWMKVVPSDVPADQ